MKRSYRSLIAVVAAILSFGLFLTACSDDDVASTGANGDEAEQDHDDHGCLLYTSDAADERSSVDLGGRRNIKKKKRLHDQSAGVLQCKAGSSGARL